MTDEELVAALQKRLAEAGPTLWLVWTTDPRSGGRIPLNLPELRFPMLVIAASAPQARKLWREYLFKNRPHEDMPKDCEARTVPADLAPGVVAENTVYHLQLALGLHS